MHSLALFVATSLGKQEVNIDSTDIQKSHLISSRFFGSFLLHKTVNTPNLSQLTLPSNYLTHRRFFTSVRNQAVTSLLASCVFAASPFWGRLQVYHSLPQWLVVDCRTAHKKYGEFLFSGEPLFIANTNI